LFCNGRACGITQADSVGKIILIHCNFTAFTYLHLTIIRGVFAVSLGTGALAAWFQLVAQN
jgi:hypothetical protein